MINISPLNLYLHNVVASSFNFLANSVNTFALDQIIPHFTLNEHNIEGNAVNGIVEIKLKPC